MSLENLTNKALGIGSKAVANQDLINKNKVDLMKAELNSDSKLVKNTRPIIVLVGLAIMVLEFFGVRMGILLLFDAEIEVIRNSTSLIQFFIVTWSGIVGTYVFKRSGEKRLVTSMLMNRANEAKNDAAERRETRRANRFKRKRGYGSGR
tara:strand:+ start:3607 stop:4056 length:450 start_codon:yes stop_codon:yes gene_type:complete